jgi:abortive infection bacteriophage resistance protein
LTFFQNLPILFPTTPATPLGERRTPAGFFMRVKFTKPSLSVQQQIELMKTRGLVISNEAEAAHYLNFIGYYRLSGYAIPLTLKNQNGTHNFKQGVKFQNILDLYRFDRELRLLVMDAIERIEVAFRACVSNWMCERGGPHWYFDDSYFCTPSAMWEFRRKIMDETGMREDGTAKGRHAFLVHYFTKYSDPPLPPSWMLAEILSISTWSKAFENIRLREDRRQISKHFGVDPKVLESWMHCVSYVRNLCAHHSRLWNREFTIRPMIANDFKSQLADNSRFYAQAVIARVLLERACPNTKWWERLCDLLANNSFIDRRAMGFPNAA